MGKTPKPPAPDPALGQAALRQAQIAQEALGMSRDQIAYQRQQDSRNYAQAQEQYGYQKEIVDKQMNWAQEDRQRMASTYRPLEDQVIRDARGWDQADNMQRRSAQAQADVQQAIGQQNKATSRMMTNMGVNPNSGRFAGGMRAQAFGNAALQAGIKNQTRGQLLNEGAAMRAGAVGMGSNLAGNSYGALGSAAAGAGTLTNAGINANQQATSGWAAGMQGMGIGANANQGAFDMQNQIYKNQLSVWQAKMQNRAATTGAVLGVAGLALGGVAGAGLAGAMSNTAGTTASSAMQDYWNNKAAGK